MTNKSSPLERYSTLYYQNLTRIHNGAGILIYENNEEYSCEFEVGQLVDGRIVFTCDCSYPDIGSFNEEISLDNAKKFKFFKGTTNRNENITGSLSLFTELTIGIDSFRLTGFLKEITVGTINNKNLQYMVFGITNFKLTEDVLMLDIEGVKRLEIRKIDKYKDTLTSLEIFKGICVTCEIIVSISKAEDTENVKLLVSDLCEIMSIAQGRNVQWIYYNIYDEKSIILQKLENRVTKPYYPLKIIGENPDRMKKFLEHSYIHFYKRRELLYENKNLIHAYIDAKALGDDLPRIGVKLVVVIEMLKELAIKLKLTTKSIINEEYFDVLKPEIEKALSNAIEQSINYLYGKKSEQDKEKIIKEIREEMLSRISNLNDTKPPLINKKYFKEAKSAIEDPLIEAIKKSVNQECREKSEQEIEGHIEKIKEEMLDQISGLNYTPFKKILRNLCDYINLQISDDDLQSVVYSRNRLIHEGKFFCDSDKIKNKYKDKEKYPQFQDSTHEYFFLINFLDKCFLKLLCYKGFYINWNDKKEEELL